MISIQNGMLVVLGFLLASLVGLLAASAFWSRAVRLTTKRLKEAMPVSEPEIKADRDRLRAEYAIRVHKLEAQLEQAKFERARHLIDINRRDATISTLESDVVALKTDLDENQNARRVLEQTVVDRLPKVEARLMEARRLLFNRDREIAELTQGAKRQKLALEEASSINAQKAAQIDRLSSALTARGGRSRPGAGEPGAEGEVALRAEAEALRTKTREQAALIDRLQRRLEHGYVMPAPAATASAGPAALEAEDGAATPAEGARERAPAAIRAPATALEREMRTLKARAEDQAGEIARLKAALAAFESNDQGSGLKNSKLALKARAGSAEAQAEQQAATISRLRAELAATNERLARQAAHFMDEMRRVGGGTVPVSGQPRRSGSERRNLVERVAQVRPVLKPEKPAAATADLADELTVTDKEPTNGRDAAAASDLRAAPEKREAAPAPASAAEMPKTDGIPGNSRKLRLLDRITGLSKT